MLALRFVTMMQNPPMTLEWRHRYLPLVIVVLMLAAGLRFHQLGAQSLWHDEGNAYVQATRSLSAIADNAARDIHPPGYYWALAVWRRLLGDSEFGLRSLSAFASLLSVALTFALGKRLFGMVPGVLAAAFVALNTFSIYYAQEARMYALLALWAVASMWALAGLVWAFENAARSAWRGDPRIGWAVALGVCNAAGLYTQYAFPFVMLAQGVLFVGWYGLKARRTLSPSPLMIYTLGNLLALLLYAPWMATAWEQVTTWPNTGEALPVVEALATIIAYFAFGITVGTGTTIAVMFFLLFGLLQLPQQTDARSAHGRWRVWAGLLPVLWVVVAVGCFLVLELFREANLKFLLPAQMGFALWLARGVWVLWHLPVRREGAWVQLVPRLAALVAALALLVQMAAGIDPLYTDTTYQRDDYRGIVAAITADPRPDGAIILNGPNQQEVFNYYYDGEMPVYGLPRGLGGDDAATLTEMRRIIATHGRIYAVLWATQERDPNGIVEGTLDREAFAAGSAWYGDVRLNRYAAPVTFAAVNDVGVTFAVPGSAADGANGGGITLLAYGLSAEVITPGDVLQVQLQWRADAPITARYKVFVQLLAPDGAMVTQHDAEPGGDARPTPTWAVDEVVIDNHALIVPNDLPPAHYTLITGLYNPNDPDQRLMVEETSYYTLGIITISE